MTYTSYQFTKLLIHCNSSRRLHSLGFCLESFWLLIYILFRITDCLNLRLNWHACCNSLLIIYFRAWYIGAYRYMVLIGGGGYLKGLQNIETRKPFTNTNKNVNSKFGIHAWHWPICSTFGVDSMSPPVCSNLGLDSKSRLDKYAFIAVIPLIVILSLSSRIQT